MMGKVLDFVRPFHTCQSTWSLYIPTSGPLYLRQILNVDRLEHIACIQVVDWTIVNFRNLLPVIYPIRTVVSDSSKELNLGTKPRRWKGRS